MPLTPSLRLLNLAAVLFAAALPLSAQTGANNAAQAGANNAAQAPPAASTASAAEPALQKPAKEVSLLAVVRDKKGEPMSTLAKDDFSLVQDGHPQTITQFASDTALPLTIGIVADTGPGARRALAGERKAATGFFTRMLRQGSDHGFVLHFDREVELLQDITTSQEKLAKGIDELSAGLGSGDSVSGDLASGDAQHRGRADADAGSPRYAGDVLYDAIFLSADEVLRGRQGRKVVVLLSDGLDGESKTSLSRAMEAAERAGMLIYCVYVQPEREPAGVDRRKDAKQGGGYPGSHPGGSGWPGSGGWPGGSGPFPRRRGPESAPQESRTDGRKILQQIAAQSGGRYFELNKSSAEKIYAQIEEELRHQYSLSYTPDEAPSGYHRLRLTTKKSEMTVETAAGFYAD